MPDAKAGVWVTVCAKCLEQANSEMEQISSCGRLGSDCQCQGTPFLYDKNVLDFSNGNGQGYDCTETH